MELFRHGEAIIPDIAADDRHPLADLSLDEACALAAAWACAIGEQSDIRLLVIKGPSLAHHGLRPPRTSADVDLMVDPYRFDEFCVKLQNAGWRQRATTEVGAVWAGHSLTYMNDLWPCDIDVHRYFPGFLADTSTTIDVLWESRDTIDVAHRAVPIPNRVASILIAGLHHLRDGQRRLDELELASLTSVELDAEERRDLVELAQATESLEPARGLLERLGFTSADLPEFRDSTELRAWRARTDANASGAYYWLLLMERSPRREWIGIARRALWPPREALMIDHPGTGDSVTARIILRLSRLPAGLRGLLPSLRAMWKRDHS